MAGALNAGSIVKLPVLLRFAGTTSNLALRANANASASFRFATDGLVYTKDNNAAWVEVGSWTNQPGVPSDVEVRYTNAAGDTGALTATAAEDAWHAVTSSNFELTVTDTTPTIGGQTATFDMEIRDSGDVTQDSEGYSLSADREDS